MKQDILAASTAALLAGALLLPITMPKAADATPLSGMSALDVEARKG